MSACAFAGEFFPGAVSDCYYEPDWDPHAPFIPSHQVAFADEMGYDPWKWLLLALFLSLTGLSAALVLNPALLGGEEVMGSTTVVESWLGWHVRGGSMH